MPGGHRRARTRGKVGLTGRRAWKRGDSSHAAAPAGLKGRRASKHASAAAAALAPPRCISLDAPEPCATRRLPRLGGPAGHRATRDRPGSGLRGRSGSRLRPGPERPSPAPPCCRGHGGDQMATLERAQRDVQRPRSELELGRELRGRDGARVASRDHIEHRLLARGEVVGGIARQRSTLNGPPEERRRLGRAL